MIKPVCLGLSILDISKMVMNEYWSDFLKLKYGNNVKLCHMDTDSFKVHVKTKYVYADPAVDVQKRFDTSNYEVDRPLQVGKNKNVMELMKGKLNGKMIKKFVALRPKIYSYMTDDGYVHKEAKGTKKCAIKQNLV